MATRGNPFFMHGVKDRRDELQRRLRSAPPEEHRKILARFALEFGLRDEKVHEYFTLIKRAGYLDVDVNGNYLPI